MKLIAAYLVDRELRELTISKRALDYVAAHPTISLAIVEEARGDYSVILVPEQESADA